MFTTDGQFTPPQAQEHFDALGGEQQYAAVALWAFFDAIGPDLTREGVVPVRYTQALQDISQTTGKYPRRTFDTRLGAGEGRQKVRAA